MSGKDSILKAVDQVSKGIRYVSIDIDGQIKDVQAAELMAAIQACV